MGMIYKFLIIPFLCISSFAYAEAQILTFDAQCDDTKIVVELLSKKYREIPIAFGDTEDVAKSKMSIWVNPATKSWSLVATKEKLSCIIGVGENFEFIPLKPARQV